MKGKKIRGEKSKRKDKIELFGKKENGRERKNGWKKVQIFFPSNLERKMKRKL